MIHPHYIDAAAVPEKKRYGGFHSVIITVAIVMKKAYNLTEGDIMAFEKTDVRSIDFNPVTMFADNWALLSGKVGDKYN